MESLGGLDALGLGALFLLGLLGGGHCVGMCGPLVLAFPARVGGLGAQLAYNLGRITTYTAVGLILGSLGGGLARYGAGGSLVWTMRIQLAMSLLAALFLGLFGLSKLGFLGESKLLSLANPARIPGFRRLQRRLTAGGVKESAGSDDERDRPRGGLASLFLLGLLLGLLPCGLSFAAFSRALAAGGPLAGGAMTLAFGLGTLPSLLIVGLSAHRLSATHRRASDIIAGMLMIGMAALLLLDAIRRL